MRKRRLGKRTELFLVRFNLDGSPSNADGDDAGDGSAAWRGRLQRVVSGETREFSDWSTLKEALNAMLLGADEEKQDE